MDLGNQSNASNAAGPVAALTVTALVEDGVFEQAIQPSVALFAETVWNPHRDEAEILQLALSPYCLNAEYA